MDAALLPTLDAVRGAPRRIGELARAIVRREGGWVDDPADPGGATNHGISLRYSRSRGQMWDLDRDGDVDADDIRRVTPELAAAAYIYDFYLVPRLDLLPPGALQANVWDMAVNAGPAAAVRLLQEMLNRTARAGLKADGQMGPRTAAAAREALGRAGDRLMNEAYSEMRKGHYRALAAEKPKLARFLRGWLNRADEMAKG